MTRTAKTTGNREARLLGLALTTALAGITLTGCAHTAAPAVVSASKAEAALAKGQYDYAIEHAEKAVLADPSNAKYRAVLGAAYLDAGRFNSAATSFDDAMVLGDKNPRTALSLALALAGDGKGSDAVALLDNWQNDIVASDLGLAYSLAGRPDRGIDILSDAVRGGENTAKTRQNLAFSYALAGHWREARLMAQQDIGGDKVGERMAEWAAFVSPDAYRERVGMLLSVTPDPKDPGQPLQLALANGTSAQQLAAEAATQAPKAAEQLAAYSAPVQDGNELAPVGDAGDPAPAISTYTPPPSAPAKTSDFATAFSAQTPPGSSLAAMDTQRFVQSSAPQSSTPRARGGSSAAKSSAANTGTHLVQLGSFSSEQSARRAWSIYVKRYPQLASHDMVITEAMVQGKHYWRVSAGGYNAGSSRAMCGTVKSSGRGCFAYAESSPLPGALDTDRRLASR